MTEKPKIDFHLLDVGDDGTIPPFEDFARLAERLTGRPATVEERAAAQREYDDWVAEASDRVGRKPASEG